MRFLYPYISDENTQFSWILNFTIKLNFHVVFKNIFFFEKKRKKIKLETQMRNIYVHVLNCSKN